MTKKIFISLLFLLLAITRPDALPKNLESDYALQKVCKSIIKNNSGTILIINVKNLKSIVDTCPKISLKETYPPGSIFKIISTYTLLEEGINPNDYIACSNFYESENYKFTCCLPEGHGRVNLTRALSNSCAVYFYKNSKFITPEKLINSAKAFGFGKKIKAPSSKKEYLDFLTGEGECIKVTPYEITLMMRHLILEDTGGNPKHYKLIKNALLEAVEAGNARNAKVENLHIAGKTGTATNLNEPSKFHGWFAGFAPYGNPEIIVVVFLKDGRGYMEAAEIAGKVFKIYFKNENYKI